MGKKISVVKSPVLPEDVLVDVFRLLSLKERKNVRLVCRSWYQICNCRIFLQAETFFFGDWQLVDQSQITQTLANSQRQLLNVHFKRFHFEADSHVLWETCGEKIESLAFSDCTFADEQLEQILARCANLNALSITGEFFGKTNYFQTVLNSFCAKKMVRTKIVSLFLQGFHAEQEDMHQIFMVFPNVRALGIAVASNGARHFKLLLSLLQRDHCQVNALNIAASSRTMPVDLSHLENYNWDRLRSVALFLSAELKLDTKWLDSVRPSMFKFWTTLQLSLDGIPSETSRSFLVNLLNECPQLANLAVIVSFASQEDFFEVFVELVKSRLLTLRLRLDGTGPGSPNEIDFAGPTFYNYWRIFVESVPFNCTLRRLTLLERAERPLVRLFVKAFPNVYWLSIPTCPHDISSVLEITKNLLALEIQNPGRTLEAKIPRKIVVPILEYLKTSTFQLGHHFRNVQLNMLRYTDLKMKMQNQEEDTEVFDYLREMIKAKAPNLVGLRIVVYMATESMVSLFSFKFCLLKELFQITYNLKKLRYYWIRCDTKYTDKNLELKMKVFMKRCRKLRCVFYENRVTYAWCTRMSDGKIGYREESATNRNAGCRFASDVFEFWLKGRR